MAGAGVECIHLQYSKHSYPGSRSRISSPSVSTDPIRLRLSARRAREHPDGAQRRDTRHPGAAGSWVGKSRGPACRRDAPAVLRGEGETSLLIPAFFDRERENLLESISNSIKPEGEVLFVVADKMPYNVLPC